MVLAGLYATLRFRTPQILQLSFFLTQTAPVYNKAVDTGADVLTKVQTTYVYKTAANRLYPVISPYADPVIEKVPSHMFDPL